MEPSEAEKIMRTAAACRDEWSIMTKLAYEKEMLGIYVSDHPLRLVDNQLAKYRTLTMDEFEDAEPTKPGKDVELYKCAGMVSEYEEKMVKTGKMVRFMLDDMTGVGKVTIFPKTLQNAVNGPFGPDAGVKFAARLEDGEFGRQLIVVTMEAFDLVDLYDKAALKGTTRVQLKGERVSLTVVVPEEEVERLTSEAKGHGLTVTPFDV